jgi:hypothetical protein
MPAPPADAPPGLSLVQCMARWSCSRNTVKARARLLGVALFRAGDALTLWLEADLARGDELHQHLVDGGRLADFRPAIPTTPAPAAPAPVPDTFRRRLPKPAADGPYAPGGGWL